MSINKNTCRTRGPFQCFDIQVPQFSINARRRVSSTIPTEVLRENKPCHKRANKCRRASV